MMNRNKDDPRDRKAEVRAGSASIRSSSQNSSSSAQKAVSFLGDSEKPQPLSLSGETTSGPATPEEAKEADRKPEAALSKPVSTTSSSVGSASDEDYVLMGQTFSSLLERDIPDFVRQHAMALTFPQKLMLMIMHVEQECAKAAKKDKDAPIAWMDNGLAFVIRDQGALVSKWLPLFFRQSKFASFTRKLYRWQFRQVFTADQPFSKSSNSPCLVFGHESFQRDRKSLMANMRSVTAEAKRREEATARHQQQPQCVAVQRTSLDLASLQEPSTAAASAPSPALPPPVVSPTSASHVISQLGSLAASLDSLTLLRSVHQAPPNSDSQRTLLQLLVAQQQISSQQDQANEAMRQLVVALLTSQIAASASPALPPPPPPPAPEPRQLDDQENLRQLVSLLLRQSSPGSSVGSPLFPHFPGPPPS